MKENFDLGRLVGRHEAFTAIAGRCTAAQVATMREVRDSKLYSGETADFGEFTQKYFHTGKDNANRLIRLLDEFGPNYFLIAQFSRISPDTYRAIAPSIRDGELRHNGEAIALIPENAAKVSAAVEEIRKTVVKPKCQPKAKPAAEPEPPPPADPIAALEAQCTDTVKAIERMIHLQTRKAQVHAALCYLRDRLNRLESTI